MSSDLGTPGVPGHSAATPYDATLGEGTAFDIGERVQVYDSNGGLFVNVGVVDGIRREGRDDLYAVRADDGQVYEGIEEMDLQPEACGHPHLAQPSPPIPDWVSRPCPDCGERCTYNGRGGLRSIRENNALAAARRPEVRLAAVEAERDRAMGEVADLRVRLHRAESDRWTLLDRAKRLADAIPAVEGGTNSDAAIQRVGATLDEAAETGEDPERTVERLTELVLGEEQSNRTSDV